MGFVGVLVLFLDKTGSLTLSSALIMLLGAFLWATSVIHYKKFLNHMDPLITHFSQLSVGIVPLVFLSLTSGNFVFPVDSLYIEILVFSSVGALAVGNIIWFLLLREEEATTLSGSSLIVPAIAMFFGWRLLGESFSAESLLGSALTLGGVYLLNIKRK
jgi:drug/metabolite transporter (DMT)-like permease